MSAQTRLAPVIAHDAIPDTQGSELIFPELTCQLYVSKLTCLVGPHRSQLRAYLLMLAGIYQASVGKVEVFGQSISGLNQQQWRKLRCQIGYLSGAAPLQSGQNGLMNVMLPALYHANWPFQKTIDKAQALLSELHCHFEYTAFPAQLNSFQKAQMALARALLLDPALLILDVPFNDLGAKEREKMGELLATHQCQRTVCMIGGLQYPHFLADHADQIIFISEHKIINFNGWTSFSQSEDADVKELLSVL